MSTDEKQSYPKALWIATPGKQTRIFVPDPNNPSRILRVLRFREGSVLVRDEYEEQLVRRHTRGQVWEQDLTEPRIDPQSGWICYSTGAYMKYLEDKRRIATAPAPTIR